MFAIVQTGGKQYRVQVGDKLEVEKLERQDGEDIELETLLVGNGDQITVGQPSLENKVKATVIRQTQGEKLIVYNYKRRKGYDKKRGHRQPLTLVEIKGIG